jgi:hypothetical protein
MRLRSLTPGFPTHGSDSLKLRRPLVLPARLAVALLAVLGGSGVGAAQEAPRKPDTWIGAVTAIDAPQRRLMVQSDSGDSLWVAVDEKARLLRAKPGAKDLADATPLAFEALAVGDRVLLRGTLAEDKSSLAARQVVVMTHDDIAQRQDADRADWRRRGILGVVTMVDAARGEITLQMRRFGGTSDVVLPTAGRKVVFKRYAPDSVKFSDARGGSLAEVKVGDQLRALGERSADGAQFTAEQIVFGSFRTAVGQVQTVDASKGELKVHDDQVDKDVTVVVGPDARLKRLPPEFAARFGTRAQGNGAGAGPLPSDRSPGGPGARTPPTGAPEGGGGRQWRAGGGGGEDLIERFPPVTLAELKAGDRVLVASTQGADPSRLNAIALVSGLEALRPAGSGTRMGRGVDVGLPPDLMDMGMGMGAP